VTIVTIEAVNEASVATMLRFEEGKELSGSCQCWFVPVN